MIRLAAFVIKETDLTRKKSIRLDVIIIAAFIAAGIIFALFLFAGGHKGSIVKISVDGEVINEFPLDKDATYEIEGYDGGTNLLVIENGEAYIKEASCPDGLCIHMGRISTAGQSVVCLPNRVVVSIDGGEDEENIDHVVG